MWGLFFSESSIIPLSLIFAVIVRMLRHRVVHRREDVSHEDHGRHQAWDEKNRSWARPPLTQKPWTERRSGGRVWCELSRDVAWERQGRAETTLTHIGQEDWDSTPTAWWQLLQSRDTFPARTVLHRWTPTDECVVSLLELFGVFIDIVHAAKLIQVQVRDCLSSDCYVKLHACYKWPFGWK